ncbi:MAG: aldehyde dehydrogenase family protein [Actinobacteria bacterium]|nr:aldehyde dehydrogenase family protein [Actinomycetota bacterium]
MTDPVADWRARAAALPLPAHAFVDGEPFAGAGERLAATSPLRDDALAELPLCDEREVDAAVAAARRAFEGGTWSQAGPRERKRVMHAFVALLEAHREELALLITLETGKPIRDALREIDSSGRELRFFAEAVDKVYGDVVPTAVEAFGYSAREPVGVVAAVTPWNFPVMMPVYKLGPALAAGNSVVLKPAEQSSLAGVRLVELGAEAGLPDGVLNAVTGTGEVTGRALGLHPDVDVLTFTGSTAVGKLFLRCSGESNMKAVWLECGGKSPQIVLADAPDLERAAAFVAEGIFHGAGEVCNAGSRLIVEESIHDDFVGLVAEAAVAWAPGDPFDEATVMGPLVDRTQFERVVDYIGVGLAEGASLARGGAPAASVELAVEPTVLTGVEPRMRVAREEIFGPVLATIKASADAVAAVANDSIFGLAAGVWTGDVRRAHRLARELDAGTVYVNTYDRGENSLPFGGYKQSGIGVDRSLHALEKYMRLKTVWFDLS